MKTLTRLLIVSTTFVLVELDKLGIWIKNKIIKKVY